MMNLLKLLFITLIFATTNTTFANSFKCEGLFPDSQTSVSAEAVLEQAGEFELVLKNTILQSKNSLEIHNAANTLTELEKLIEVILENPDNQQVINFSSQQLEKLSHYNDQKTSTNAVVTTPHIEVTLLKKAQKDVADLQPHLVEKFKIFINEVSTLNSIQELPKSWDLEKIDMLEITKDDTYSVRLNQGYRILFTYFPKLKTMTVYRISKTVTH